MTRPSRIASLALLALGLGGGALAAPGCGGTDHVRTILVTGFGPFGDHAANPSWEAVQALDGRRVDGAVVRTARLDVSWGRAAAALADAIDRSHPAAVLCLGVASDDRLRLEVTARNRDQALPDVDGVVADEGPIREGGPEVLPTRLPLVRMRRALEAGGFEFRMSEDAGGYLCNHVFYRLVADLAPDLPAGFVHVPVLSETWSVARIRAAVVRLVETIASDLR